MKIVTIEKVIESLTKMVETHGLPISKTSNNGPHFASAPFKGYVEAKGIEHRNAASLRPQKMERLCGKIALCQNESK